MYWFGVAAQVRWPALGVPVGRAQSGGRAVVWLASGKTAQLVPVVDMLAEKVEDEGLAEGVLSSSKRMRWEAALSRRRKAPR